jgi:hypothetical protein
VRDPEGSLQLRGDVLVRGISPDAASRPFLKTPVARQLVQERLLVPFVELSDDEISVERVSFTSSPFEWCDAQFKSAADLTLRISREILQSGHELKDASAWNVLFDGCVPVFCDHLSFQPIRARQWWAFGQFLRHFLLPLQISASTGLTAARLFRMSRDGVQATEARQVLGVRMIATRLWPLLAMHPGARHSADPPPAAIATGAAPGFHKHLYGYCAWVLAGLDRPRMHASNWIGYTESRSHYNLDAQDSKLGVVAKWLDACTPRRLVDVGSNTGEFTNLAVAKGIAVIAIEQDHQCVSELFRKAAGSKLIHPVLSNLGDLCGGAGWLGVEHPSLMTRLRNQADMVLLLAVIHHLAISESIPLNAIADFAADLTSDYAIVEFLDESDPMLERLALQRNRRAGEFGRLRQEAAFQRRFGFVARHELPGSGRCLVLMRRLAA